jgi:hypothetical protein
MQTRLMWPVRELALPGPRHRAALFLVGQFFLRFLRSLRLSIFFLAAAPRY